MLCIETYLKKTEDRGIGVFSKNIVKKGTIIWQFKEGFDLKVHKDKLLDLNSVQKEFIDKHFYRHDDYYYSSCDYSIFQNHSNTPNSVELDTDKMVAARDILSDEEILVNYSHFDEDFQSYENTLFP